MYVPLLFLGALALTKAQFFDKKVDIGTETIGLTALKDTLETLIENVTKLEEEIETLRGRSCSSVSRFRAEMQQSANAASASSSILDTSGFVLKSTLSAETNKVNGLVQKFESVQSAHKFTSDIDGYAADLNALESAYETQTGILDNVENDLTKLADTNTQSSTQTTINCTDGWTKHENHCYAFFRDSMPWHDAMSTCIGHGAYLLEVNTKDELNWLKSSFLPFRDNVWVGGVDILKEGVWQWAGSGELLADELQSNWASFQPDNYLNAEHYMELNGYSRTFNDQSVNSNKKFACEKWLSD
ncbi:C-type lectin domain family 4 member F-like [Gigantopelta aegis]|uniref:C-type lectin domain family 4 member F-like n=1 Tax=Gigantopelta aegis TaxID=1735272 RepID=UPI001B888B24|nr:C-type lectin domain family 4 member F-like [Gigantopelta aegis]